MKLFKYFGLSLSLTLCLGVFASAQNVNVTATGGAPNATYATLKAAFDAVNGGTHTGAITLRVVGDTTERETAVLNSSSTGAANYTSVLITPSGAPRTITTSETILSLIKLNGADNVTIDGSLNGGTDRSLTFVNPNVAITAGVIWLGSASATDGATNNVIKNTISRGGRQNGTLACIVSSSGTTVGGNAEAPNSNNTYRNNLTEKAQNGIVVVGPGDTGNLITENQIGSTVADDKIGVTGIALFQQTNAVVSKNIVAGVLTVGTSDVSGIRVFSTASNILINANRISDVKNTNGLSFGSNGIRLSSTSTAANVTVSNNFITDIASRGFNGSGVGDNGYGIVVSSGGGYNIFHNSVHLTTNQTVANSRPAALNITNGVTTANAVDVRNNIFSVQSTVGNRYAAINNATQGAAVFTAMDYNDYFAQNVGLTGTTARATLADWQTATGKDQNSKAVDPLFVSATDLHLQAASPLINAATPISGVTIDIDGQTRGAQTDIGADEFGAATRDAIMDFNGDGKTDWAVIRGVAPGNPLTWYIRYNGQENLIVQQWGLGGDQPAPLDYDGDGKDDIAVYRGNNGFYYILNSATNTFRAVFVGGVRTSSMVAADYDGDGKDDPAVYIVPTATVGAGNWCYAASANNPQQTVTCVPWGYRYGTQSDQVDDPYPGDFDGDGKADFRVQRRTDTANGGTTPAVFYTRTATGTISYDYFGLNSDRVIPGDYDGDGKTDLCVARGFNIGSTPPTPIQFFIRYSSGLPDETVSFGNGPNFNFAQGDYDGDGKDDIALWVNGNPLDPQGRFWVRPTANPTQPIVYAWGAQGDLPAAGYNNR